MSPIDPRTVFKNLRSTGDLAADISAFLTTAGKTGTLKHIRQVVEQARALATRFGADVGAAAFAYLDWVLHNAGAMGWTVHDHVRAAHAELSTRRSQF